MYLICYKCELHIYLVSYIKYSFKLFTLQRSRTFLSTSNDEIQIYKYADTSFADAHSSSETLRSPVMRSLADDE